MNKYIFELCRRNNIKINKFYFMNKIIIIESDNNSYFCKMKDDVDFDISKYNINFPMPIDEIDSFQLYLYDNFVFDLNEKYKMLIDTLINIHNKSKYDDFCCDDLYNDISLTIKSIREYYLEIQDYIENFTFPKLYYYFLLINISSFYNILNSAQYYLDKWYGKKDKYISKGVVVGNVSLCNFCCGEDSYFLDYSNIDINNIIYDIVNFYKNEVLNFDIFELINYYFSLVDVDKDLFLALICIPNRLNFSNNNYKDILKIRKEIDYINKTFNYISEENEEDKETD